MLLTIRKQKNGVLNQKTWGPNYNTAGNELFPSIGKSGKFFFASDGHKGIGGLDIFYSNPVKDKVNEWSAPKEYGLPNKLSK